MHFTIYFLALFFVPAFAAPFPQHEPGDFVAVKQKHLGEEKQRAVSVHPAVVTKKHPDTEEISVNLISNNYDAPNQEPIGNYYHHPETSDSHLTGKVRFNSVRVKADVVKIWKNKKGNKQTPMEQADLKRLQEKTSETPPHTNNHETPPRTNNHGASQAKKDNQNPRQQRTGPQRNNSAHPSSQPAAHGPDHPPANPPHQGPHKDSPRPASSPNSKGHVNAHASSSKLPVPAQGHNQPHPPVHNPAGKAGKGK